MQNQGNSSRGWCRTRVTPPAGVVPLPSVLLLLLLVTCGDGGVGVYPGWCTVGGVHRTVPGRVVHHPGYTSLHPVSWSGTSRRSRWSTREGIPPVKEPPILYCSDLSFCQFCPIPSSLPRGIPPGLLRAREAKGRINWIAAGVTGSYSHLEWI